MDRLFSIVVVICWVWAGITHIDAADSTWPGWLGGAERSAWVSGVQIPKRWPKTLAKQWQIKVGAGYGSPVVDGPDVFVHSREGDNEIVRKIDLKSGRVHWQQAYPVPFKIGGGGEFHGKGPKSSPALADGRLFTLSITGVLSAWETETGVLLWRRDYSNRFPTSHPYWGVATSPLVDGDRIFVHFGNDEVGLLIALDVVSGEEIWVLGDDGPSYSSPLVAEIDGVRQIIEWNHEALVGVDRQSGQRLWSYPFPHVGSNQNMPTPTFHHGRIILGGENRGIHCIQPQRQGDRWTARAVWHQDQLALDMSSAVINGDYLFGFSHYDSGRLFSLDPANGEILWTGPPRTGNNVMFLSVPGFVIALIDDGELRVIAADPDQYRVVASYHVSDDPTWAPPVLVEQGVLIKDKFTLALWAWPEKTAP